jgi:hypothetical protein
MNTHSTEVMKERPSALPGETERLTREVGRWGVEAGFMGTDDENVQTRLEGLIRQSSIGLYGDCDVEIDRIHSELESIEIEWNAASRTVIAYRAGIEFHGGLIGRFLARIRAFRDYRDACCVRRRLEPELRKLRLDLGDAESRRSAAAEWQTHTSKTLLANYRFQKSRGAMARPVEINNDNNKEENSHDTREARNFIVHRAN